MNHIIFIITLQNLKDSLCHILDLQNQISFLKVTKGMSSFLSLIEHSLKGQRTGSQEVQYWAKIKRGEAMKYSPLELNYF